MSESFGRNSAGVQVNWSFFSLSGIHGSAADDFTRLCSRFKKRNLKPTFKKDFSLSVHIHFLCIIASNVVNVRFFLASGFDVVGSCALHPCVTGLICQPDEDMSVQKQKETLTQAGLFFQRSVIRLLSS